jgi:sulfite reductase alpha subunit-like flavoprotein
VTPCSCPPPPCPSCAVRGDLDKPFPGPTTLGTALAYFADLLSSPHKDALLALASCATEPAQAARLRYLASSDGKAEANEYIYKQHRSLLEVGGGLVVGGERRREWQCL